MYVDLEYLKNVGTYEPDSLDDFNERYPGRVDAIIESISRIFDARLSKRYAVPFEAPYPEAVKFHIAQIVCHQVRLQRGSNLGSEQDSDLVKAKDDAWAWVREAADAKDGLVELPLREDPAAAQSAVKRSGALGRSDASPYAAAERLRARGRGIR